MKYLIFTLILTACQVVLPPDPLDTTVGTGPTQPTYCPNTVLAPDAPAGSKVGYTYVWACVTNCTSMPASIRIYKTAGGFLVFSQSFSTYTASCGQLLVNGSLYDLEEILEY